MHTFMKSGFRWPGTRPWFLCAAIFAALTGCKSAPGSDSEARLQRISTRATADHELRRLNEASAGYVNLLAAEPPRDPTPAEWELLRRCCPLLRGHPAEFFPLNDFVALLHPTRPWIGFHLFWGDDIDFPDDNDPTDHEVIWVEYDPVHREPIQVTTYFHERLISTSVPAGQRPLVAVEWGKHGSVPFNAAGVLVETNGLRGNWKTLHDHGARLPNHPLARKWPKSFPGGFDDYLNFSVAKDPRDLLDERRMGLVTRWANAALNQHFLPYCFAPKTEWPAR